jgi:hypothetical protein
MGKRPLIVATEAQGQARMRDIATEESREEALRERVRKNSDFVQFTRRGMREYSELLARSPFAGRLLVMMAEKMDYNNALVASSQVLEELTGSSRSTVARALSLLKKECWMDVVKLGTANAYVINSGVFWTSYGDRKHACFQATILATSTDQDSADPKTIELKRFPFLRKKDGERALVGNDKLPPPDQQDLDLQ